MKCPYCKKTNVTIGLVSPAAINGIRPMEYYECFECKNIWYTNHDLLEVLSDLEYEQ